MILSFFYDLFFVPEPFYGAYIKIARQSNDFERSNITVD